MMDKDLTFWPPVTAESRPWTRWWWMGSSVDKATISALLESYAQAGLGGVEITPIYGVKGQAHTNLTYLSSEWLTMLRYAIDEAHRLGMLVDLPPGCGWRMGGEFVTGEIAAATLDIKATLDGYEGRVLPSGERVKRGGPGGNGLSFNPFSRAAINAATDYFEPTFRGLGIRAQFHDSWEYDSNACVELFERFIELRGYDLQDHLGALIGEGSSDYCARVKYDVQLTLGELALDDFIVPWAHWCHALGQLSRNQAHGSPGNLLDLYAAVDIPETEVFRTVTPDTPLMSKFASSAAHVTGKKIASSETATWLGEHFNVTLSDVKLLVDNLFVSGINHHVYHGTAYSPAEAEWPGWLFYASTQFNPQNPFWRDFEKLNAYVTRCQSMLQDGKPDSDLLVYFPFHDVLQDATRELAEKLTIDGDWLRGIAAYGTYRNLWQRGYSFDYISDRQITALRVCDAMIVSSGNVYKAILVPTCSYLPEETLANLVGLQAQGAQVIFQSPLTADVPGFSGVCSRRERFAGLMRGVQATEDVEGALGGCGILREPMVDIQSLWFIRRRFADGHTYFIANQGKNEIDTSIQLSVPFVSALVMDPMSGDVGCAQVDGNRVRLQLDPGAAWVLRTSRSHGDEWPLWRYVDPQETAYPLSGPWQVTFIDGGPVLPALYMMHALVPWTDRNTETACFAGTAVYTIEFDAPQTAGGVLLDLGDVRESARVYLNGKYVDTLIGPTYKTPLTNLRPNGNVLQVEVTNLAANRIREMDRQGVEWRIFEDINFVNREYQPFDASDWPVRASGLLGPVRLIPVADD